MRESENETEASTTFYLYDREDRIADCDPSGNLITAYTHGPGIDEPVAMTLSNSTYLYIPDIQGSIRAIVDTQGNAMATYQYDVWGTLVSYNGTLAQKNDYLYTGREYDWQTGIYYYRARYYNPELGRFISQDPAGMVDGPNMYVYVKNEPVNGVDASGRWSYALLCWEEGNYIFNTVYSIAHDLQYAQMLGYEECVHCCEIYYNTCNAINYKMSIDYERRKSCIYGCGVALGFKYIPTSSKPINGGRHISTGSKTSRRILI